MAIDVNKIQSYQNQLNSIFAQKIAPLPQMNMPSNIPAITEIPNDLQKDTFAKESAVTISVENNEVEKETNKKEVKTQTTEKEEPKHKSTIKDKMASTAKTVVKTGEYIKAASKTLVYGAIGATLVMFGDWLFKGWGKVFKKQFKAKDMFNHPLKCVSKGGKVLAGITAALIGGFQFAKAYLNSNQKTANIDHKLKTEDKK